MSKLSLMFAGNDEHTAYELHADFEEWYYSMEDHEQEELAFMINSCKPQDTLYLAGHKVYLTDFSDAGVPIFQPMVH